MRRVSWTTVLPILAAAALALSWGRYPGTAVSIGLAVILAGAVLAAVHHAEVIAHRVGEPFGSLVLAVAVTVIEVGLIVTLMVGGDSDKAPTLARDTVFAAIMITVNGIMGLSLWLGSLRHGAIRFNAEGSGGALATVVALASLCLVAPTFTVSAPGPVFTTGQLVFVALASLVLYGMFVLTQTVRHRDFFLPVRTNGELHEGDEHAEAPSSSVVWLSLVLLVVSLVTVVGLAKVESPAIEGLVAGAGLPESFVGVIIAMLVLAPETLAAAKAAHQDRVQTSLNLALGSAIASIGLTIPTLAFLSIALDMRLALGLDSFQLVLLALTVVIAMLTVVPGRATRLQGGVHLVVLAAFVVFAASP